MGEEDAFDLIEVILKQNPDTPDFEKKAAQIAVYFLLQKTVPQLLENKYLTDFRNSCEETLRKCEEVEAGEVNTNLSSSASASSLIAPSRQNNI